MLKELILLTKNNIKRYNKIKKRLVYLVFFFYKKTLTFFIRIIIKKI